MGCPARQCCGRTEQVYRPAQDDSVPCSEEAEPRGRRRDPPAPPLLQGRPVQSPMDLTCVEVGDAPPPPQSAADQPVRDESSREAAPPPTLFRDGARRALLGRGGARVPALASSRVIFHWLGPLRADQDWLHSSILRDRDGEAPAMVMSTYGCNLRSKQLPWWTAHRSETRCRGRQK